MNISLGNVLQLWGTVIGDPLHQEGCVWVGDDGKQCRNTVPKTSRVEGASCLQALQDLPSNYSTKQKLVVGGKFFLCSECRRHRCRPRKWADSLIHTLSMEADRANNVENDAGASRGFQSLKLKRAPDCYDVCLCHDYVSERRNDADTSLAATPKKADPGMRAYRPNL